MQRVTLVDPPRHLLPPAWIHGFNVTAYRPEGFSSPQARAAIAQLAATGVRDAVFAPVVYQDTKTSSEVAANALKTPSDDSLLAGMRYALSLGLRVGVKPHVDVHDGSFRGEIAPDDPQAWFTSYEAVLLRYARLAQTAGAQLLVIGTELNKLQEDADRWRRLIRDVRGVYRGRLAYAANWSPGPAAVQFWDALDYVGVDAYWPLSTPTPQPSVAQLVAAWAPYVRDLAQVARKTGKPALLTEVGFPARAGSHANPANPDGGGADIDRAAQARAYEAVYRAWRGVPELRGVLWWEWSTDARDVVPGGYSPAPGFAVDVVRTWAAGN